MGEGDVIVRYTKRVGSFFLAFLFAHISTFHYEKHWIALGHRLAARIDGKSEQRRAFAGNIGVPPVLQPPDQKV
jgi:hypothetical protein